MLNISASNTQSGAKISYDSIKDNLNLTIDSTSGSGTLTIDTGNNTDINLAGFKAGTQKLTTFTVDNVNAGDTVKLNKTGGLTETIKLKSAAGNGTDPHTTITGLASGDKLDYSGAFSGFTSGSFTSQNSTFSVTDTSKGYYFNNIENIDFTEQDLGKALISAIQAANSSISSISISSSKKAIFALNSGDGNAYLFSVSAGSSNATLTASTTGANNSGATVKLLAVVDNTIDSNDQISGGSITFA